MMANAGILPFACLNETSLYYDVQCEYNCPAVLFSDWHVFFNLTIASLLSLPFSEFGAHRDMEWKNKC